MKNIERAGASRPSRRLVLKSAVVLIAALTLLTIGRGIAGSGGNGWNVKDSSFERADSEIARHLLENVNGANDVVCAAVERAFNGGYWGSSMLSSIDRSGSPEADETARWIGKNDLDRDVLNVARPALASTDACTRRIAARIAGNADTKRLDEELRSELASSNTATRLAAVRALGFAEQDASLPVLQRLVNDSNRDIRVAALWGIGSLENEETAPMLIQLLQSDPDADIRRIAAWGLGQLDD